MLFYYVRHGDPTYTPDALTPLGIRQAEALAKRLALYGLDKIYCSTSNRAVMTAQPTCEILKMPMEMLDLANERHAWDELTIEKDEGEGKTWLYQSKRASLLFNMAEMRELGERWYDHPELKKYGYEKGFARIADGADEFFRSLGYEHERNTGRYRIIKSNDQRVALFAHQGFGLAFLSALLDVPYPMFCTHFDMCHTGLTVIDFEEYGDYAIPKMLTLSSDSHLYREGLPTKYSNLFNF